MVTTLLSLTQWAQIMGLDPLHFYGGYSGVRPLETHCHDCWLEYQWQAPGRASRADVALAIHGAEVDIASTIGHWPAWIWVADERHRIQNAGRVSTRYGLRTTTRWGYVIGGGAQAVTDIAAADVTREADLDADGDGFAEFAVFTLTGIDEDWDIEQIKACFKDYAALDATNTRTDPSSTGFDEAWEIRPLHIRRSGTVLRVYVPIWLMFRPQLQHAHDAECLDADDANSYVDTINFYRVYPDHCTEAQLLYGAEPCDEDLCGWAGENACIRVLSPRAGTIDVRRSEPDDDCNWTTSCPTHCTSPTGLRLYYRAGLARPAPGVMDHGMARLVAMLAASRLDYPVCSCDNVMTLIAQWRENAAVSTRDESVALTPAMLGNPFGTRMGEVLVWQSLNVPTRRIGRAVRT